MYMLQVLTIRVPNIRYKLHCRRSLWIFFGEVELCSEISTLTTKMNQGGNITYSRKSIYTCIHMYHASKAVHVHVYSNDQACCLAALCTYMYEYTAFQECTKVFLFT